MFRIPNPEQILYEIVSNLFLKTAILQVVSCWSVYGMNVANQKFFQFVAIWVLSEVIILIVKWDGNVNPKQGGWYEKGTKNCRNLDVDNSDKWTN